MTTSKRPPHDVPATRTERSMAPDGNGRARIVVGADASYWGRIALRWAAEYALLAGAELAVYTPPTDSSQAERGDEVGAVLQGFPLLPVATRVSRDAPGDLVAASRQADLVVLGCRGSDHPGIGLGATVTPVAAGADCDVMVVGGHVDAVRGAHHQISVLVGTDADEPALGSAARLAALRRVPLRILVAAPMMGNHPVRDTADGYLATLNDAAAQVHALEPTVRTATDLIRASPQEVVAASGDTDVLVVGVAGRLDATARMALYHAPNPVLLAHRPVPAPPASEPAPRVSAVASRRPPGSGE